METTNNNTSSNNHQEKAKTEKSTQLEICCQCGRCSYLSCRCDSNSHHVS